MRCLRQRRERGSGRAELKKSAEYGGGSALEIKVNKDVGDEMEKVRQVFKLWGRQKERDFREAGPG